VDKNQPSAISPEPIVKSDVNAPCISAGRLPPYPPNSRLAKGPEFRLGVFFLLAVANNLSCQWLLVDYWDAVGAPTRLPLSANYPI
jgi:hypothetical protein